MEGVSSGWDTEKEIDAVTAARICAAGAARARGHTPRAFFNPRVVCGLCCMCSGVHIMWEKGMPLKR